ncbi:MAG: copper chaperone [Gemmatales bacterium]
MPTQRFSTNLRCAGCIATIQPLLDATPAITTWSIETESPQKVLSVESREPLSLGQVNAILQATEYRVLTELNETAASNPAQPTASYFPLLLILLYLLGITATIELAAGSFHLERAMRHFMAGFFLVFSFFKLLNLQKFADAYRTYDVVARRSRLYGLAYPFIELGLGIAYILHWQPVIVNVITLVVMGVSTIGVVQSLLARKTIQCACLGTVFNLPMSSITLVEDLLMVSMSALMLFM